MFPQPVGTPVGVYICSCTTNNKFNGGFYFSMYNIESHISYREILGPETFMERYRKAYARHRFTEHAVRKALITGKANFWYLLVCPEGGIDAIVLNYVVEGSPRPLQWRWKVEFDCVGSLLNKGVMTTAGLFSNLLGKTSYLLNVIKSKDDELEWYRKNSSAGVISKRFDVKRFESAHQQTHANVRSLCELAKIVNLKCTCLSTSEAQEERSPEAQREVTAWRSALEVLYALEEQRENEWEAERQAQLQADLQEELQELTDSADETMPER
ncbi:hypothetical protein KR018_001109 [Drosophila ironensis]|nr:hypothetical protein KR018_001109 [Drosophila ironensis]